MLVTVMYGAGDFPIENVPDARIIFQEDVTYPEEPYVLHRIVGHQ